MVNQERICREFAELVGIDSPSFGERQMADRIREKLSELRFKIYEDQAGDSLGSHTGNLYGFLKGTLPGEPVLLSAHLDTVAPAEGKKAVFHESGKITSAGDTVLGSDDVAGIVEILEGIRHLQEEKIPHRDVEVLFSVAEEAYARGSGRFDYGRIQAKEAYVLDLEGEPGTAALAAPTLIMLRITVQGKSSHAGFAPEMGIHAIQVMCDCISRIQQGRIDDGTTLNLGLIRGGTAVNIVPDLCVCEGEIRSLNHEKALKQVERLRKIFQETTKDAGAKCSVEAEIVLTAYKTDPDASVVRRFRSACDRLQIPCRLTETFGGSDNNHFAVHGIEGVVLSCGMHEVHSVREYTTVQELMQGAELVADICQDFPVPT